MRDEVKQALLRIGVSEVPHAVAIGARLVLLRAWQRACSRTAPGALVFGFVGVADAAESAKNGIRLGHCVGARVR